MIEKKNVDTTLVRVPREITVERKYAVTFWTGDGEETYKSYAIGVVESTSFSGADRAFVVTKLTPSIGYKLNPAHWLDELRSSRKLKLSDGRRADRL